MTAHDVPADVRAAALAICCRGGCCHGADPSPFGTCQMHTFIPDATAALAAAYAVRLAGAGDVVERLSAAIEEGAGQLAQDARTLITTQIATIARLERERDAARETALAWHAAFKQLGAAFRVNMLRHAPETSHADIDAAISSLIPTTEGGRDAG